MTDGHIHIEYLQIFLYLLDSNNMNPTTPKCRSIDDDFKDLFQDSVSALASLACNSDDDGAISKMSQVQPVLPQYLNKKSHFSIEISKLKINIQWWLLWMRPVLVILFGLSQMSSCRPLGTTLSNNAGLDVGFLLPEELVSAHINVVGF